MIKQSKLFKGLHSALDELELLFLEGEMVDVEIVEGLMERFKKLQKNIKQKSKK